MKGSPVAETCEAAIDNTWKYDAPDVEGRPEGSILGALDDDLRGRLIRDEYAFTAYTDDGIRVTGRRRKRDRSWRDQATTRYDETVKLGAGEHTVVVEFYENGGEATARVSFELV